MKPLAALIPAALLSLSLTGCVIAVGNDHPDADGWEHTQAKNSAYIDHLELGTSQASVRSELGKPDLRESFQRNGEHFDVLFYRTRHRDSDGHTSRDETTPLVFVDGRLVGWGDLAIDKATGSPTS